MPPNDQNYVNSLKSTLRNLNSKAQWGDVEELRQDSCMSAFCSQGRDSCGNYPVCKANCAGGEILEDFEVGPCDYGSNFFWNGGPGNWSHCLTAIGHPGCWSGGTLGSICNASDEPPGVPGQDPWATEEKPWGHLGISEFYSKCSCGCKDNYNCETDPKPPSVCGMVSSHSQNDHPFMHGWVAPSAYRATDCYSILNAWVIANCPSHHSCNGNQLKYYRDVDITGTPVLAPDLRYNIPGVAGSYQPSRQAIALGLVADISQGSNKSLAYALAYVGDCGEEGNPCPPPPLTTNFGLAMCYDYSGGPCHTPYNCPHAVTPNSVWRGIRSSVIQNPCEARWVAQCGDLPDNTYDYSDYYEDEDSDWDPDAVEKSLDKKTPPVKHPTPTTGPFQGKLYDKCNPKTWRYMNQPSVDDKGNPRPYNIDPRKRLCKNGCFDHLLLKNYDCSKYESKNRLKTKASKSIKKLIRSLKNQKQ